MNLHTLLNTTPQRYGSVWIIDNVKYTQREGKIMAGMVDKDKLAVHSVKKVFGGEVR